jgi:hypothetical protein
LCLHFCIFEYWISDKTQNWAWALPCLALPWFRRLVIGLTLRWPVFDAGLVCVGYVVNKVALGQVFPRVLRFSRQFHSTGALLLGKGQKTIIIIVTIITGLHNKPQGCGASVASAAGPFTTKKNQN